MNLPTLPPSPSSLKLNKLGHLDAKFAFARRLDLGDFQAAFATDGDNVYAGGYFSAAGSTFANSVAKWDGTNWTSLGTGSQNGVLNQGVLTNVKALATDQSGNVYVGGDFATAGGLLVNHIAKWNGPTWQSLGSGVNDFVSGIAVGKNLVYVAGGFKEAGGIESSGFAVWQTTVTDVDDLAGLPNQYELYQNYPNPFNPVTTLRYQLASPSFVSLKIYNVLGEEIANLVEGEQSAGYHEVIWNAEKEASGIYYARMIASDVSRKEVYHETKKLLLMK